MDQLEPLISVIMPAYNAGEYIAAAINSVIGQTYDNWELIVVNDGSSDHTQSVLSSYLDPRISVINCSENNGVSYARNLGLEKYSGKYLVFLDADDILPPDSLKVRMNLFQKDHSISFVDGKVITYDGNMKSVTGSWIPTYMGPPLIELARLTGSCFWGPSWMVKSSMVNVSFDTSLSHGEDLWFYMQLSSNPHANYAYITDTVLHHRSGHTSAMSNLNGLEGGYRQLFHLMRDKLSLEDVDLAEFKRKTRSIMIKSYLSKSKLASAVRVLFSKRWQ